MINATKKEEKNFGEDWKIAKAVPAAERTQRKHRKHRYENISSAVDLFLNRNMTLLRSIFVVDVFTSLLNAKLDSQPVCACLVVSIKLYKTWKHMKGINT